MNYGSLRFFFKLKSDLSNYIISSEQSSDNTTVKNGVCRIYGLWIMPKSAICGPMKFILGT